MGLQEKDNDRKEGENLLNTANGKGVTPIKKIFNTFQPIANNLSGFSHPLYLIGTMRIDVKTAFLNGSLKESILLFNQKVHCKGPKIESVRAAKVYL